MQETVTQPENILESYNKELQKANYEQIKRLSQLGKEYAQIILDMRFSNDSNPVMKEHFVIALDLAYDRLQNYNALPDLLASRLKAIEKNVFFNTNQTADHE